MTLQEKMDAIEEYCMSRASCEGCPLKPLPEEFCYVEDDTDPNWKTKMHKHYELLFGKPKSEKLHTGDDNDSVRVTLTRGQCKELADFLEIELIEAIRRDKDIDNIEWVHTMTDACMRLRKHSEGKND